MTITYTTRHNLSYETTIKNNSLEVRVRYNGTDTSIYREDLVLARRTLLSGSEMCKAGFFDWATMMTCGIGYCCFPHTCNMISIKRDEIISELLEQADAEVDRRMTEAKNKAQGANENTQVTVGQLAGLLSQLGLPFNRQNVPGSSGEDGEIPEGPGAPLLQ